MSNWIKCNESLPNKESGNTVLVFANDIVNSWVEIVFYNGMEWINMGGGVYPAIITHWQPLPKAPAMEEF
tara:strand:+ start:60 stop:269 length:210 start_codon:yes stop_codon:yes gene_type:complete